jgi:hypothetical protein
MAYVRPNAKTKKQLKELVASGTSVEVYQPGGMFGLTLTPERDTRTGRTYNTASVEGPHYPEPHRWYAVVEVDDNYRVTRVVQ